MFYSIVTVSKYSAGRCAVVSDVDPSVRCAIGPIYSSGILDACLEIIMQAAEMVEIWASI